MDNNNREHKKEYHEFINFATQGMSENAQFSIAIAVGIFGILAIFVSINDHHDQDMSKNALWLQKPSIKRLA
jgi:deoxyribodipyrimidine photolyase